MSSMDGPAAEKRESVDDSAMTPSRCHVDKKGKSDQSDDSTSWRAKCIEKFGLEPVPDGWKDSVDIGSEEAWERYYECRSAVEDGKIDDEESEFMDEWVEEMDDLISQYMTEHCKWHWTPRFGDLVWEDYHELRSAEYYAHVWSPYAIPHAIELEHRYHRRVRWSTMEFFTIWGYRKIDFEDGGAKKSEDYTELCSNCFKDEKLRADVIKSSHLNKKTGNDLRAFLYGANSEECKQLTCSDMNFWLLFFGSMGTTDSDLKNDPKGGDHGYVWDPWRNEEMRKKLYDLKAEEGNDGEGDPNGPFKDYYPKGCSWLKYKLLHMTNNLGDVTKHYEPPTIKDAAGYNEWCREEEARREKEDELEEEFGFRSLEELLSKKGDERTEAIKKMSEGCNDYYEASARFMKFVNKSTRNESRW